jgi:hypothetical protein
VGYNEVLQPSSVEHFHEGDVIVGGGWGSVVGDAHNVFFEMPVDVDISSCLRVPFMLVQVIVLSILG